MTKYFKLDGWNAYCSEFPQNMNDFVKEASSQLVYSSREAEIEFVKEALMGYKEGRTIGILDFRKSGHNIQIKGY
jgi:hypothetical protein